jgi:hypothetical protein
MKTHGDKIKKDEMGGAFNTHGRYEKFIDNFSQKAICRTLIRREGNIKTGV